MNKEIIIALCAGEASGDLLGAHLIDALKQQYGNIRFVGIGGPRMKAAGLIGLEDQEPLAVRGYVEVLGNLSTILKIRRHLIDELKKISPHVFVGIDSPNFNLPVAEKLKAAGIPTLHYVSPSVWAWKPERVHKIVKQVNKVLCLFPMEPQLYRDAGGRAEYVGHPLAQILPIENSREAVRERLKLGLTTPVFTLLPGSRISEVDFMTPLFLRAAALILRDLPESVFLMPYPSAGVRERLQHYLQLDEFKSLPIRLQAAKTELACMAADVVLVTSGTASLEVALCKRPMVISYKISRFTYSLVRRKIKIPYVGLPNILLNKPVVPELLQHNATPEKLAAAMLDWYYHPARVDELEKQFVQLHQRLKRNTDELAAYEVLSEAGLRLPKPVAEGEDEQQPEIKSEPEPDSQPTVQPENTQPETSAAPEVSETASSEPLLIPPPSIVMGNISHIADKSGGETVAQTESAEIAVSEPQASPESEKVTEIVAVAPLTPDEAGQQTIDNQETSLKNKIQYNESDMSKAKRKSGLFGWLASLFGGGSKPIIDERLAQQRYERVGDDEAHNQNASLKAVSRTEDADVPNLQPEAESKSALPSQPSQPNPINLPKSGVLAQQNNKPNIFSKYMPENHTAQAEQNTDESAPTAQTQSAHQPALKVKVTAVMREPEEVAAAEQQHAQPISQPTQSADESAPVQTAETAGKTAPQHTSALADYINQASMAWLPDSVKHNAAKSAGEPNISQVIESAIEPVSEPVVGQSVQAAAQPSNIEIIDNPIVETNEIINETVAEPVAAAEPVQPVAVVDENALDITDLVGTVEPIVKNDAPVEEELPVAEEILAKQQNRIIQAAAEVKERTAPRITIQVAPKVVTKSEPRSPMPNSQPAQTQNVAEPKTPQIQANPVVVEVKAVNAVVEAAPVPAAAVIQPAAPVAEPEPVVVETVQPTVSVEPVQPVRNEPEKPLAAPSVSSFASVFRRHTLRDEPIEEEEGESQTAPSHDTEEPAQIVLNRSEAMTAAPTQAAQIDHPNEEGLPAPSVSNYNSNPNRYNKGIFF